MIFVDFGDPVCFIDPRNFRGTFREDPRQIFKIQVLNFQRNKKLCKSVNKQKWYIDLKCVAKTFEIWCFSMDFVDSDQLGDLGNPRNFRGTVPKIHVISWKYKDQTFQNIKNYANPSRNKKVISFQSHVHKKTKTAKNTEKSSKTTYIFMASTVLYIYI